jgi:hypothetical protein
MPRRLVKHTSGYVCVGISRDDCIMRVLTSPMGLRGGAWLEQVRHWRDVFEGYILLWSLPASWLLWGKQFCSIAPFHHGVLPLHIPQQWSQQIMDWNYVLKSIFPPFKLFSLCLSTATKSLTNTYNKVSLCIHVIIWIIWIYQTQIFPRIYALLQSILRYVVDLAILRDSLLFFFS